MNADGTFGASSVPGGGGFGKLAIGPVDVGVENMVDEWQCAQDSATGFRNVMASHGVSTAFDFRGMNSWERDFKKTSLGGLDTTYVDNVDAQWYTGHGWSGGFWDDWQLFHGWFFMTSLALAVLLTVYSMVVFLRKWRHLAVCVP